MRGNGREAERMVDVQALSLWKKGAVHANRVLRCKIV